ncbi:hypothetical protein NP233_g4794 [Leucocoprinus birnbaumii]|uniref:Xylanolytic transcriptional activator regulatory domain-containing protein n=1 Tax=Leucocoprinus birnbaumii TaxID=56174 RepID=A0AAD5YX94_9AGAR|nr:hypothetical protein NP233_g4794 [Leucocoprinus birnbaumii]
MSSDASRSPKDKQSFDYIIRSGLAGGVAGCVAKSVVAPLDRVKILFQASNPEFQKYAGTFVGTFRAGHDIYRQAGFRGLFQGHSATLIRIFPYAAIKFMAYDQVHHVRLVFLSAAGMKVLKNGTDLDANQVPRNKCTMSVFFTYPLELIRVRMAFHTRNTAHDRDAPRPSFTRAFKHIYNERPVNPAHATEAVDTAHYFNKYPLLKFYRGFTVTMAGMVPYAGVSFLCWGYLRSRFLPPAKAGHETPTPVADLAFGAFSGAVAQTASYPFEVVRRRMQVGGITRPDRWLGWGETVRAIWQARGWRGFYVGLSIGYMKVIPMTAVSFAVWQGGKRLLNSLLLFDSTLQLALFVPHDGSTSRWGGHNTKQRRGQGEKGEEEAKNEQLHSMREKTTDTHCGTRVSSLIRRTPAVRFSKLYIQGLAFLEGPRAPHLCKWESMPDGPSPNRSPQNRVKLEGIKEDEDELPPALRTTKLDLNENREMLEDLSKRIRSLESKVVSTTGPASAPAAVGPRRSSMSMDGMAGGYGSVEGMYQPGPFASSSAGAVVGGYDWGIASAPILTESMPSHDVSSGVPIASPSMQPPQIHLPARPQPLRRQSGVTFRVPSAPRDEPYTPVLPFSLVHPGEYVGRANASSTVHSIRSISPFRLPQTKSTAPSSLSLLRVTPSAQTLIPTAEIQHLIQYLPDMQSGNLMIDAFFKEVNWRYGLPEKWLSTTCSQMWTVLQNPAPNHQLNPYWLCLFFAILACSSKSLEGSTPSARLPDRETYYLCASTARRVAEDRYFSSSNTSLVSGAPHSSPADGSVLGCLAIPLLCDFLAARGRVSESWKLMGEGIRVAQSIGLHRDPACPVWQDMPDVEKDLRRRAWWGLYIWDRPQMIRCDDCDVAKPSSVDAKGRKDSSNMSRVGMIQLSDLMGEILDKCMSVTYATWTLLTDMDSKFETWEMGIPPRIPTWHNTRAGYHSLRWSLTSRNPKLQPPSLHDYNMIESPGPIPESVAEKCVRLALELIKYQCDTFDRMQRTKSGESSLGENWYFEGCLSLFEAAVALLLALTKFPTTFFVHPNAIVAEEMKMGFRLEYEEMTRVISRVMDVFSEVVMSEKSFDNGTGEMKEGRRAEIASKALDTLQALLKEHWWKLDPKAEQGRPLRAPSGHPSPQEKGLSPAAGMSGPRLAYGGPGYVGPPPMGSLYTSPSQQPVQLPFRGQQVNPAQVYSGLVSPTTTEAEPSPPLSIQQQLQHQPRPNVYGSSTQYPMTTVSYASVSQPPFKNPPLPEGNATYQLYSPRSAADTPVATSPLGMTQSSPYDYHTQQNYFPGVDTPASNPFPFVPISSQNSSQTLDQGLGQQQPYHRGPQRQFNPIPTPTQRSPLQTHASASASTYNFYNPASAAVASASSSVTSGGPTGHPGRPLRASPGVPPPSQGMKMIHYVGPGSTTTSTTMASSGASMMGGGMGSMSFGVGGVSQESLQTDRGPEMVHSQHQSPQESRIVLSEFTGHHPTPPTGQPGPPTPSLARDGSQSGSATPAGGYYQ